jgi:hypothetical protein
MNPLDAPGFDETLRRICGEYLEMPGLRLNQQQAQRLWGLDCTRCAQLLRALVECGFLCQYADGAYGRSSDGAARVPSFAKPAAARISAA